MKRLLLLALLLVGAMLLLGLSHWQWQRAIHKQAILSALSTVPESAELPPKPYQRLSLRGHYLDNSSYLLDNRFSEHRIGYEVLTPFRLENEQITVLVNRGWVAAPRSREQRPEIKTPEKSVTLQGTAYFPGHAFLLKSQTNAEEGWPKRIQRVELGAVESDLSSKVQPFVLILDENQPGAYVKIWTPVVVSPARHRAYAVQWFALAVIYVVTIGILWRKRGKQQDAKK